MTAIWSIIAAVFVLTFAVYLVLVLYPSFGGRRNSDERDALIRSKNYDQNKFVNTLPTSMSMTAMDSVKVMGEMMSGSGNKKPARPIDIVKWQPQAEGQRKPRITWLGHSALLLELDGKHILLDPMLGRAPSPFPAIGGKRFSSELPVRIEDLPPIDAVILSHDHYDHLDFGTIKRLKNKVRRFFVPLGVAKHLERWGVDPAAIDVCDWWDERAWEGLTLACTPARHFSGRALTDRNATLWCSWVIASGDVRIFFSGDSGYGPHFEEIGERYGPFDLTLMECGQYDPRWAFIHMMPEETVQAHQDVRGKVLLPIHWGAFTLSVHDWRDPVERASAEAVERGVEIATPRIGESFVIGGEDYPTMAWWREALG
ncbi:L-ascorbate metabolism protein UlaG (beta-lactamase superfamily) [Paenibacillus phyllosphaerae]|uniref:L-ascorbate metabolism protein UlaG (Beta-lactamase superfamily) n=1 Tax=Paenibacillus phyllosphaerae TaxID=274593 RepID=A0A7W5FN66_9BACL|nr:MBL fold metallo-hydrolase [Paenibacillus phyllosphaerae]MBB3110817.1 L-ascorbate metabolism protein UlaG (beta-lactamase superfamily) [Paenibacillus phyllosphaerae]